MEDYTVWGVRRTDAKAVAIDLASGQATGLGKADKELVDAALSIFNQDLVAESWSVTTARSLFYSDYTDAPDWRDVWSLGWTLDIRLSRGSAPDSQYILPYEWLERVDSTWDGNTQVNEVRAQALFFAGQANLRADLPVNDVTDVLEAHGLKPGASQNVNLHKPDRSVVPLIRSAVGILDFPKSLKPLNGAVADLRDAGWLLNWREFL